MATNGSAKAISPPNLGGRPTKLTEELCERFEKMVAEWDPFGGVNLKKKISNIKMREIFLNYMWLSTKDNVAYKLGISRVRLYEYEDGKTYKNGKAENAPDNTYDPALVERFRNILKMWETKRNAFHMPIRAFFPNGAESTWIFLGKNFNQFTDTIQVTKNENINHNIKVKITNANAGSVLDILAECGAIPPPDKGTEH